MTETTFFTDTSVPQHTKVPSIPNCSKNDSTYQSKSTVIDQGPSLLPQNSLKNTPNTLKRIHETIISLEDDSSSGDNSNHDNQSIETKDSTKPSFYQKKQRIERTPSRDSQESSSANFENEIPIEDTESLPTTDISPVPSIENFGTFTCITCKKKIKSKNKIIHAVQHCPGFFPLDSLQRTSDNSRDFVCSYNDCKLRCSKALRMQQHYATDHGELEKYLKKDGRTLSDLYLTKRPRRRPGISSPSSNNPPEKNALRTIKTNQTKNHTNLDPLSNPTPDTSHALIPSDINSEIEVTKEIINEITVEDDVQLKIHNKTQSEFHPGYSPISSDAFSDQEEMNGKAPKTSEQFSSNQFVPITYPEIDTEAETDKEDNT